MRRKSIAVRILYFLCFGCGCVGASDSPPELPVADGVRGIVAAFSQRPVVLLGEHHVLKQAGDFYIALARDPEFQKTCNSIVVEFACRTKQPLIDRYVNGEQVPDAEIKLIWRDTHAIAQWESTVYSRWLAAIREVNKTLAADQRLRVIGGDTAIDWTQIKSRADYEALGDNNNVSFSGAVLDELAKGHKVLVVLGMNHVFRSGRFDNPEGKKKGGPPELTPNTTSIIDEKLPGKTFVVVMVDGNLKSRLLPAGVLDRAIEAWKYPVLCPLNDNALGELTLPGKTGRVRFDSQADAVLYLCPTKDFTAETWTASNFEPEYTKEIRQRCVTIGNDPAGLFKWLGVPMPADK